MSTIVRQHAINLAIACFVIGFATTAFAVPPEEVLQIASPLNFTGPCCFSFSESIAVTEPAKPVPVVVTWQVNVLESGGFNVGLMVNGGSCMGYGSGSISNSSDPSPRTFQWIIFPSDGLRAGSNTFTLCGGGTFGDTFLDTTAMTLIARLSN
jgi:hypothetical protein